MYNLNIFFKKMYNLNCINMIIFNCIRVYAQNYTLVFIKGMLQFRALDNTSSNQGFWFGN